MGAHQDAAGAASLVVPNEPRAILTPEQIAEKCWERTTTREGYRPSPPGAKASVLGAAALGSVGVDGVGVDGLPSGVSGNGAGQIGRGRNTVATKS